MKSGAATTINRSMGSTLATRRRRKTTSAAAKVDYQQLTGTGYDVTSERHATSSPAKVIHLGLVLYTRFCRGYSSLAFVGIAPRVSTFTQIVRHEIEKLEFDRHWVKAASSATQPCSRTMHAVDRWHAGSRPAAAPRPHLRRPRNNN